jgi:hypothetical protein
MLDGEDFAACQVEREWTKGFTLPQLFQIRHCHNGNLNNQSRSFNARIGRDRLEDLARALYSLCGGCYRCAYGGALLHNGGDDFLSEVRLFQERLASGFAALAD